MKKRKLALFQRVGDASWLSTWSYPTGLPDDECDDGMPDGYVRLSPYLEIDFPYLDRETVVAKQLEQLDKAEQTAREELQQRLNAINDTRQKLLSLTFQPAA